jgi:hypothetical protein
MTDVIDRPLTACPDPDPDDREFQTPGTSTSSEEALRYLEPLVDSYKIAPAIREFMYLALNGAAEIEELAEVRPGRKPENEASDLIATVANVARGASALLALLAVEASIPGVSWEDLFEDLFMEGPRPDVAPDSPAADCLAALLVARRAWFSRTPYKMMAHRLRSEPGYVSVSN